MIWGIVIGIVLGAILVVVALVIWANSSDDIPTYADGYRAGEQDANEKNAVVIRGLLKKQQVHDTAYKARKDIVRAVIDAYKEEHGV